MKRWQRLLLLGITFSNLAFLPSVVSAQEGIVPGCRYGETECENAYNPDNYGVCELVQTFNNVLEFLIGISAIIIALIIIYAGFLFIISRGNASTISKAKSMFSRAVGGFVIILVAFLVVNTILKVFIGGEGNDILSWQVVDCAYSRQAGDPTRGLTLSPQEVENLPDYQGAVFGEGGIVLNFRTIGGGGNTAGGTAVGGRCAEMSTGPCSVSNLEKYFPGNAAAASRVCNMESGGTPIWSTTDRCKDGTTFSGGYFQINIIAHAKNIPGCSGAIKVNSGGSPQGACLERVTNSQGVRYCAEWDCQMQDQARYNTCRRNTMDSKFNLEYASKLYKQSGNDFTDWAISAGRCNAPY